MTVAAKDKITRQTSGLARHDKEESDPSADVNEEGEELEEDEINMDDNLS